MIAAWAFRVLHSIQASHICVHCISVTYSPAFATKPSIALRPLLHSPLLHDLACCCVVVPCCHRQKVQRPEEATRADAATINAAAAHQHHHGSDSVRPPPKRIAPCARQQHRHSPAPVSASNALPDIISQLRHLQPLKGGVEAQRTQLQLHHPACEACACMRMCGGAQHNQSVSGCCKCRLCWALPHTMPANQPPQGRTCP